MLPRRSINDISVSTNGLSTTTVMARVLMNAQRLKGRIEAQYSMLEVARVSHTACSVSGRPSTSRRMPMLITSTKTTFSRLNC